MTRTVDELRRPPTAGLAPRPRAEAPRALRRGLWFGAERWRRAIAAVPSSVTLVVAALLVLRTGRSAGVEEVGLGVALAAVYLFAYRSPFESGVLLVVPTQPVLLALVLTVPLQAVPLVVLVAVLVAGWLDGKRSPRSLLLDVSNATHTLAYPLVLWGARDARGLAHPSPTLLVCAVLVQLVLDAVAGYLMERPARVSAAQLVGPLRWTWACDLMMSVIGWAVARACGAHPWGLVVLIVVPVLLVRFLGRDRERYLSQAVALHDAYAAAEAAARRDALTGLLNRLGWEAAVEDAQRSLDARPDLVRVTVLYADLDRLKVANDLYGHAAGDRLITEFAGLLHGCAPGGTTIARLGGDEFAMMAVQATAAGDVDLATPVREALLTHSSALPVPLSASLGQAYAGSGERLEDAVHEADLRACTDKKARRMCRDLSGGDRRTRLPGARGPGSAGRTRVFVP